MVEEILRNAGVTNKECRFIKAPKTTYAVWFDSFRRRGADRRNCIYEHDSTIELYAYAPDEAAEEKIEYELDKRAVEFAKQERSWIESEQLYMTIYEFSYVSKEAI